MRKGEGVGDLHRPTVLDLQRLSELESFGGERPQDADGLGGLEVGREGSASMSASSKLVENVGVVVPSPHRRGDGGVGFDGELEGKGVDSSFEGVVLRYGLLSITARCGREEGPVVVDEEMGVGVRSSRGAGREEGRRGLRSALVELRKRSICAKRGSISQESTLPVL